MSNLSKRKLLFAFLATFVRTLSSLSDKSLVMKHWKSIELMRLETSLPKAPIDTMGAVSLTSMNGAEPGSRQWRFQALLATMLSPQTKDKQTHAAFTNLAKLVAPEPLTAAALAAKSIEDITDACRPASFYATKARNIKEAAKACKEQHNNDIPSEITDLFKLKGIGPKVGYLTFSIAWGRTEGICVDTHVHRYSNI
jgi:endonuclease III